MTDQHPKSAADAETTALANDLRVTLGQLNRAMRRYGTVPDLTRSQTAVLGRIERDGPATRSALARAEGVTPQSMGVTTAGLEEAGLIVGAPDPLDGRKIVMSLTDEAIEMYTTGRLAREDWLFRAIRSELSTSEEQQLRALLPLLKRLDRAE